MHKRTELVFQLVLREIAQRTRGTLLGAVWLILQPLLQVISYWFLLDVVLRVKMPGTTPYASYFLVAMLPWLLIQDALLRSLSIFQDYAPLYLKTIFPTGLLPLIPVVLATLIYGPVYLLIGGMLSSDWLTPLKLLPYLIGLGVWLLPGCYLLAILSVYLREIAQIFPFLLTMLLYVTPILYPMDAVPALVRGILGWNVLSDWIQAAEWLVFGSAVTLDNFWRPWLFWLFLLPLSGYVFKRLEIDLREAL